MESLTINSSVYESYMGSPEYQANNGSSGGGMRLPSLLILQGTDRRMAGSFTGNLSSSDAGKLYFRDERKEYTSNDLVGSVEAVIFSVQQGSEYWVDGKRITPEQAREVGLNIGRGVTLAADTKNRLLSEFAPSKESDKPINCIKLLGRAGAQWFELNLKGASYTSFDDMRKELLTPVLKQAGIDIYGPNFPVFGFKAKISAEFVEAGEFLKNPTFIFQFRPALRPIAEFEADKAVSKQVAGVDLFERKFNGLVEETETITVDQIPQLQGVEGGEAW